MRGIKCIAEILEPFGVVTLLPAVEPDRKKRNKRKRLPCNKNCLVKQLKFVPKATEHFDVYVPKTYKLCHVAPPFAVSEEIENKHRENSRVIKVNKGYQAKDISEKHRKNTNAN